MEARHSTSKFPRISMEATVINQKISRKSIESARRKKKKTKYKRHVHGNRSSMGSIPSSSPDSVLILGNQSNGTQSAVVGAARWGLGISMLPLPSTPPASSLSLSLCFFLRLSIFLKQWSRGGSGGKRRVEIGGKSSGFWKGREAALAATAHRRRGDAEYSCERTCPREGGGEVVRPQERGEAGRMRVGLFPFPQL